MDNKIKITFGSSKGSLPKLDFGKRMKIVLKGNPTAAELKIGRNNEDRDNPGLYIRLGSVYETAGGVFDIDDIPILCAALMEVYTDYYGPLE